MSNQYDFDKIISRKDTDCAKWGVADGLFGEKDILPMWVADMDFPIAKEITAAIKKRADHEIYGYAVPGSSAFEAVVTRMKKKYEWEIPSEWIVFTPGIVPALYVAVKAFTHPGDEVVIQSPVYRPFWSAVKDNGCQVVNNQLKLIDDRYEIDFKDFENIFKFSRNPGLVPVSSRAKMMILCSPHNPVGRVWNADELSKMGEIVTRNNGIIVSDEIHAEICFKGSKHIPFASISTEFEQRSITCVSPSKSFNLAGLGASAVIIPDSELRKNFNRAKTGIVPMVNCFGLSALEAAYNHGDAWLQECLEYLHGNLNFIMKFCKKQIPKIRIIKPEGTYLVWLDCRDLGMDKMSLRELMRKKARLGLEDGFTFGPGGEGFQRMNIACSRSMLEEAMTRLEAAVNSIDSS
ncbi:MAG: pyridoxal phosphate-dependent aminotransferase [Deltaproteobacteria bacterium]|nr:pyridoxal phosphate-dependent aminotransferase [Deltaproteobacteria bacterium]